MALSKDVLSLKEQLARDVPDWHLVHPDVQVQIVLWVLDDREHHRKLERKVDHGCAGVPCRICDEER